MLVTIAYNTENIDFNTEAVLNMLALAADGKPISHSWTSENGESKRSLTFHLPDNEYAEQDSSEFREAVLEYLTSLGYNPTTIFV